MQAAFDFTMLTRNYGSNCENWKVKGGLYETVDASRGVVIITEEGTETTALHGQIV